MTVTVAVLVTVGPGPAEQTCGFADIVAKPDEPPAPPLGAAEEEPLTGSYRFTEKRTSVQAPNRHKADQIRQRACRRRVRSFRDSRSG